MSAFGFVGFILFFCASAEMVLILQPGVWACVLVRQAGARRLEASAARERERLAISGGSRPVLQWKKVRHSDWVSMSGACDCSTRVLFREFVVPCVG